MSRDGTIRDYRKRLLKVLAYIQDHLDEAMTPGELAEVAHFSPYHFQRIFRALVGESVMGHIRRLRLERAATKLKFGSESVTGIAFGAGFEVLETFSRSFRAHFGCSASEFRKRHQPICFPEVGSAIHFGEREKLERLILDGDQGGGQVKAIDVEIRILPERCVAYVRHVGPYHECGEAWDELCTWLGSEGLLRPGMEMLGLSYDDPDLTAPDLLRYEACVTVDVDFEPAGSIGKKTIRGGDHAVYRHQGPYDSLSGSYRMLYGQWLPASGREAANAPCLEIYYNDPHSTPPEELETDILLPLEPTPLET